MVVLFRWDYYQARRLSYSPSLLMFAYLSSICEACSNNARGVSMIVGTEIILMTLSSFLVIFGEGGLSLTFRYLHCDGNLAKFIVPLRTGV